MVTGMNLEKSDKKLEGEKALSRRMIQESKQKQKPYNRKFQPTNLPASTEQRTMRRQQYKRARYQVGFVSWVLGVFSALIIIMVVWGLTGGFQSDTLWESPNDSLISTEENESETVADDDVMDGSEILDDIGDEDVDLSDIQGEEYNP